MGKINLEKKYGESDEVMLRGGGGGGGVPARPDERVVVESVDSCKCRSCY